MREIKVRAWDGKEFLPMPREVAFIDDTGVLRSRIEGIVFNEFTGLLDDRHPKDLSQRRPSLPIFATCLISLAPSGIGSSGRSMNVPTLYSGKRAIKMTHS